MSQKTGVPITLFESNNDEMLAVFVYHFIRSFCPYLFYLTEVKQIRLKIMLKKGLGKRNYSLDFQLKVKSILKIQFACFLLLLSFHFLFDRPMQFFQQEHSNTRFTVSFMLILIQKSPYKEGKKQPKLTCYCFLFPTPCQFTPLLSARNERNYYSNVKNV